MDTSAAAALAVSLGLNPDVVREATETWSQLRQSDLVSALGHLATDPIYKTVCMRRIKAVAEIRAALLEHGVSPRVLPEGFALLALEGMTYADDVDVRRMWRNLICNAVADPENAHPFVVDVLRRLGGDEARTLLAIGNGAKDGRGDRLLPRRIHPETETRALAFLTAAGLIRSPMIGGAWLGDGRGNTIVALEVAGAFVLEAMLVRLATDWPCARVCAPPRLTPRPGSGSAGGSAWRNWTGRGTRSSGRAKTRRLGGAYLGRRRR
jgi:hypothetical protein